MKFKLRNDSLVYTNQNNNIPLVDIISKNYIEIKNYSQILQNIKNIFLQSYILEKELNGNNELTVFDINKNRIVCIGSNIGIWWDEYNFYDINGQLLDDILVSNIVYKHKLCNPILEFCIKNNLTIGSFPREKINVIIGEL